MRAGCFLRTLYVNGIIMTIAAGGACRDSRASLFTNDANRDTGRCLRKSLVEYLTKEESNVRRTEEQFGHPEEPCPMLQVKHIPIQEAIQAGIEGRIVAIKY